MTIIGSSRYHFLALCWVTSANPYWTTRRIRCVEHRLCLYPSVREATVPIATCCSFDGSIDDAIERRKQATRQLFSSWCNDVDVRTMKTMTLLTTTWDRDDPFGKQSKNDTSISLSFTFIGACVQLLPCSLISSNVPYLNFRPCSHMHPLPFIHLFYLNNDVPSSHSFSFPTYMYAYKSCRPKIDI